MSAWLKSSVSPLRRITAAAGLALAAGACQDTGLTRLDLGEVAVVTGDFDSVELVLTSLEVTYGRVDGYLSGPSYPLVDEYDHTILTPEVEDVLADSTTLSEYDVLFLDCGMRGTGEYVYNDASTRDDGLVSDASIIANLRDYVEYGGKLYASDWAYELVERAFPDYIDFLGNDDNIDAAQRGLTARNVQARVVDEDLREALELPEGSDDLNLVFNNSDWAVMEDSSARVLIRGDVAYKDRENGDEVSLPDVPLLVTFDVGDRGGKVVYTSFHNEAQTTDDVQRIIEYLVILFQQE